MNALALLLTKGYDRHVTYQSLPMKFEKPYTTEDYRTALYFALGMLDEPALRKIAVEALNQSGGLDKLARLQSFARFKQ